MDRILKDLNPPQREAVETIDGPVLVLAGAGTGKTRVITYRIAYMLKKGIPPENILGMTFTNKAANEMRERVASLVPGPGCLKLTLGTFHSFCSRFLRREITRFGYLRNFTIADESDQKGLIRQVAFDLGYDRDESFNLKAVASIISNAKNQILNPEDFRKNAESEFYRKCASVYQEYQEKLFNQNMLDFDDLLCLTVKILDEFPEVRKRTSKKYRYILVDEYQDTNSVQSQLLEYLSGSNNNLCVVGDDDQSIYGWRGAQIENILSFSQRYPNAKTVKLEQNYRSTNTILEAANSVISANSNRHEKSLWSSADEGENIDILKVDSAEEEADAVADSIQDLVYRNHDINYNDFAVLYRSNHLSRNFEQLFKRRKTPYRIVGGQAFYQRKEIKDTAAYLKLAVNPRDNQSFLRILSVPPRGIGKTSIQKLKESHNQTKKPFSLLVADPSFIKGLNSKAALNASKLSECIYRYHNIFKEPEELRNKVQNYLNDIGYLKNIMKIYKRREEAEKRMENISEFINAVQRYEDDPESENTVLAFLEKFSLLDGNDKVDEDEHNKNAVTLMTVHAAKGLEFPYVYVIGMEMGTFPNEIAASEGNLEEERRLFYVAMTRAKTKVFLSHTEKRMKYGKTAKYTPSSFLATLPEKLVRKCGVNDLVEDVSEEEFDDRMKNVFKNVNKEIADKNDDGYYF